jgi:predicted nucleotidyltransferase
MTEELKSAIERAAAALKAFGAKEVYVFGSAATGTMREDSDIDLAVSGLPPEVFFKAMGAASDVLKRPFDLLDLDDDNLFTEYLKKKGKLLRVA